MSAAPNWTMNESAVAVREFYLSLRKAGFGRWDARWLTACMIKDVPMPGWFADKLRDAEPESDT